jgi:thioredoxin-like negative regulator of GroEL
LAVGNAEPIIDRNTINAVIRLNQNIKEKFNMNPQIFTEDSFNTYITTNPLVIFIIGQKYCSPCHNLQKLIEQKLSHDSLNYCCLIDLEENRFLKETLRITSTPTIMVFYKGILQCFQGNHGPLTQLIGFNKEIPQILEQIVQYFKEEQQ